MNQFVLHLVTHSFSQILTILCPPYIIRNNLQRTSLTTCFKAPLWTYLSITQSLPRSVGPYIFQNDVYRTCFTNQIVCMLLLYQFYVFNIIMVKLFPFYLWQLNLKASLLWTVCPCSDTKGCLRNNDTNKDKLSINSAELQKDSQ